jgi:coatomer subunit beta'
MCRVVKLWRETMAKSNSKQAESLADPSDYENLFPGLRDGFKAEQFLQKERRHLLPAAAFSSVPVFNFSK